MKEFAGNNVKAVKWFCGQTFFAGRQDWLSETYRRAFFRAFDETFDNSVNDERIRASADGLLRLYRAEVRKLKKKSGEPYKVRPKDEVAIRSALEFAASIGWTYNFNPVHFLRDQIKQHRLKRFFEDAKIKEVGPKLRSMIARDVTVWYDLDLTDDELKYVFPVDVWVRKLCALIWPQTRGMKDQRLTIFIIEKLKSLRLGPNAPLYFNAGLWAIGSYGRNAIELALARKDRTAMP